MNKRTRPMITGPTLAMAASRTYLTGRAVSDDSDLPACDPLPLCFYIRLFVLTVFRFEYCPLASPAVPESCGVRA
jgi:hypothetical protein